MSLLPSSQPLPLVVGRYELRAVLARGGMATVYLGRMSGIAGFSRAVAIKRLHPQFATDPAFVAMLVDEARLAGCIHHPRVVSVNDVLAHDGELLLVMEFVHGASLSALLAAQRERGKPVDVGIASRVMCDALSGLHAAHEARDDRGRPLSIVHRDVSPQNILVDTAGCARIIDFGVAKAASRVQSTREGELKGKLCYMAPEQIRSQSGDRRADVYSAAAVLWGALAGRPTYEADNDAALVYAILEGQRPSLRSLVPSVPEALAALIDKGLSLDPRQRFATAAEMADRIQSVVQLASERQVALWVAESIQSELERQARLQFDVESGVISVGSSSPRIESPAPAPPPRTEAVHPESQLPVAATTHSATPALEAGNPKVSRTGHVVATVAATLAASALVAWIVARHSVPDAAPAPDDPRPASPSLPQPVASTTLATSTSGAGLVAPPDDSGPAAPGATASHGASPAPAPAPAHAKKKRKYYGF